MSRRGGNERIAVPEPGAREPGVVTLHGGRARSARVDAQDRRLSLESHRKREFSDENGLVGGKKSHVILVKVSEP